MTNRDYGRACDPWGLLTLALIILQQATGSPCLYFSGDDVFKSNSIIVRGFQSTRSLPINQSLDPFFTGIWLRLAFWFKGGETREESGEWKDGLWKRSILSQRNVNFSWEWRWSAGFNDVDVWRHLWHQPHLNPHQRPGHTPQFYYFLWNIFPNTYDDPSQVIK